MKFIIKVLFPIFITITIAFNGDCFVEVTDNQMYICLFQSFILTHTCVFRVNVAPYNTKFVKLKPNSEKFQRESILISRI